MFSKPFINTRLAGFRLTSAAPVPIPEPPKIPREVLLWLPHYLWGTYYNPQLYHNQHKTVLSKINIKFEVISVIATKILKFDPSWGQLKHLLCSSRPSILRIKMEMSSLVKGSYFIPTKPLTKNTMICEKGTHSKPNFIRNYLESSRKILLQFIIRDQIIHF